jgi:hypothetical protein
VKIADTFIALGTGRSGERFSDGDTGGGNVVQRLSVNITSEIILPLPP